MAHEASAAGRWLTATLRNDAALMGLVNAIARGRAKQGTSLPYVVWDRQAGDDDNAAGAPVQTYLFLQVKVVSDDGADHTNAEVALDRIDALLTEARAQEDGIRIVVKRAGIIDYTEDGDGRRVYRHQGRLWQFCMSDN